MTTRTQPIESFLDELLAEQRDLTAVGRFSEFHSLAPAREKYYRDLIPFTTPSPGQQYAFEVDLDQCSGCKACVTACHSLNGLDDDETWRGVGSLIGGAPIQPWQQAVTSACHHCVDPACLNGCPVLAYDKDPVTGIVRHLDDQCIGCSYCVMKCPYEVPKFSKRLGIVRKCDMCSQRLSAGEAPACVQACPHEAIRITVVEQIALNRDYRGPVSTPAVNAFLPGSPDPGITVPSTRYVSDRPMPPNLQSADHYALRVDPSHWPLVFLLVLTQSSAGMFLAASLAGTAGVAAGVTPLIFGALVMLSAGLVASVGHLGQPLKAWRAFLGWRKSWLSREIIALNLFAGMAATSVFLPTLGMRFHFGALRLGPWIAAAAVTGLLAVFTSAMVYVDTKRPLWRPRISFGNFFGTTLLLGSSFAAAALAWKAAPVRATQTAALAALVIRTALFVWRRLEIRAALGDTASPIHFNARVIRELLSWTLPTRSILFLASTLCGLLAMANVAQAALVWAAFAAVFTFSSEIIGRYVFFAAGGSRRMPGGVSP